MGGGVWGVAYRLFAEYLPLRGCFSPRGGNNAVSSKSCACTHARRGNTPIAQRRVYGCVSLQLLRARVDCVQSAWALAASPRIFLRGFIPGVSRNVQRECYSIVYGGRLHKQGRFNSL